MRYANLLILRYIADENRLNILSYLLLAAILQSFKKKFAENDNKADEMGKLHLEPNNQSPLKGNTNENRT